MNMRNVRDVRNIRNAATISKTCGGLSESADANPSIPAALSCVEFP